MRPRVYLAGLIDLSCPEPCRAWRKEAAELLALSGIDTIDPMLKDGPGDWSERTQDELCRIALRDEFDVAHASALLVCLDSFSEHGASRQSRGTYIEIGIARGLDVPIFLFQTTGTVYFMAAAFAKLVCCSLDEAVKKVAAYVTKPTSRRCINLAKTYGHRYVVIPPFGDDFWEQCIPGEQGSVEPFAADRLMARCTFAADRDRVLCLPLSHLDSGNNVVFHERYLADVANILRLRAHHARDRQIRIQKLGE